MSHPGFSALMNYKSYFIKVPPHILLWANCKTRRAWELGLNIYTTSDTPSSADGMHRPAARPPGINLSHVVNEVRQRIKGSRDFLTSSLCFIQGSGVCYHDNKLQLPWQPQCFTKTSFSERPQSHDRVLLTRWPSLLEQNLTQEQKVELYGPIKW